MAETRLYRPNVFLGLADLAAFANPATPSVAELNNTDLVWDITCATSEDTTEFTLGDSETDTTLNFCSNASVTKTTTQNATITFKIERDEDRAATGVFNRAFQLLAYPDIPYYAIERIGKPNTAAFAVGDYVRIVQVATDMPQDVLASDANAYLENQMLTQGFINWNYQVAS
jgi:hypothetical protein